jgi:exosome complex RNA-binding protein Rrp4
MYKVFSEWVERDGDDLVFRYLNNGQIKHLVYVKLSRNNEVKVLVAHENEYAQLTSMCSSRYMPSVGDTRVMGMFMQTQNESYRSRSDGFYIVRTFKDVEMEQRLREYLKDVDMKQLWVSDYLVDGVLKTIGQMTGNEEEKHFRESEIYNHVKWSI